MLSGKLPDRAGPLSIPLLSQDGLGHGAQSRKRGGREEERKKRTEGERKVGRKGWREERKRKKSLVETVLHTIPIRKFMM